MKFTRELLSIIFQALFLAERYYLDPNASVAGMTKPSDETRASRLEGLRPIIQEMTDFAVNFS
jgi:hypothetical protein